MGKYDIVVIGAGISGAVLAERYASQLNKKVLILEKRNHIAGNCYDYLDEAGILVPKYGPHFFHTNFEDVWEYVSRYTEWHPYEHRVLSVVNEQGVKVPVPVNITTVNKLFNLSIQNEEEMKTWLEANVEKIENPQNSEESSLARVGKKLYELLFKGYTKKQWDLYPAELDASVMNRIPVRTNFDDRYFADKYQAMPKEGYTKMFEKILNNPNIEVRLETDYLDVVNEIGEYEKLFYTGPIDQFFQYKFGERLQYRSLRFEYETLEQAQFQEMAQENYPNHMPFTRITEPKISTGQQHEKTTIIREYSTWEGDPYYPVPNPRNQEIYAKYQAEAAKLEEQGIYFVGRLANYKYFNMDQAFKNALDLFAKLEILNVYAEQITISNNFSPSLSNGAISGAVPKVN
ncbi:MAG: UDP-galactopyranose mutase [Patescibacteria group bacterium]